MNMATLQSGCPIPEAHHFLPLRTISPPSTTAVARMLVASEEATSGSVMQKVDRIRPFSKGSSQRCCCSGEPYFHSTSMLPVSGALQLKISGARKLLPISSARGAYSTVFRPAPSVGSGRKRFQRPLERALVLSSSTSGETLHFVQSPPRRPDSTSRNNPSSISKI